jgi:hypothetical protein
MGCSDVPTPEQPPDDDDAIVVGECQEEVVLSLPAAFRDAPHRRAVYEIPVVKPFAP